MFNNLNKSLLLKISAIIIHCFIFTIIICIACGKITKKLEEKLMDDADTEEINVTGKIYPYDKDKCFPEKEYAQYNTELGICISGGAGRSFSAALPWRWQSVNYVDL